MNDEELLRYESKLRNHAKTYENLSGCLGCVTLLVFAAVFLVIAALLFRAGVRWSLS